MEVSEAKRLKELERENGKLKKLLAEKMLTPYKKLKSLANAKQYLKTEITFEILDEYALKMSGNEATKNL